MTAKQKEKEYEVSYKTRISPKLVVEELGKEVVKKGTTSVFGGVIKSTEPKNSTYGESIQLNGEFALRVGNKEFRSKTAFVPRIAESYIEDVFNDITIDDEFQGVQVAFEIISEESDKSQTGYVWSFKPILQKKVSSILDNLLE